MQNYAGRMNRISITKTSPAANETQKCCSSYVYIRARATCDPLFYHSDGAPCALTTTVLVRLLCMYEAKQRSTSSFFFYRSASESHLHVRKPPYSDSLAFLHPASFVSLSLFLFQCLGCVIQATSALSSEVLFPNLLLSFISTAFLYL